MKVTKAVTFRYSPTSQTAEALSTFRDMVNDAIRICLNENIKGRLKLRNRVYHEFRDRYGVVSCLPYSVAEVAWSIVKKHKRWHRRPFAKRLMLKIEADRFSLHDSLLKISFRKGERIVVPISCGEYQRSFLTNLALNRGSITMTESSVIIAFSTSPDVREPVKRVGYDLNEKSAVGSDGTKYDLSEVARLHTLYGVRRTNFSRAHPNDSRLKRKFASSRREKNRVNQALHRVSSLVVEKAVTRREAIVLERLKGIRYASRRRNRGKDARRRLALWPFRRLQAFIEYKANWAGVPVEYVSAAYTSKICSICNAINKNLGLGDKSWRCPSCGAMLDRDLNAAINIERRGKTRCLPEGQAGARGRHEAMKGNETTTAPILQAEAPKPDVERNLRIGQTL